MKTCIINLASNNSWYPKGQKRLKDSLNEYGYNGDLLFFKSESEIKSPSHKSVPYAFKPYAFKYAERLGYTKILWLDASFWAIKKIDLVFDHIINNGYILENSGHKVGIWSTDICLNKFNINREEAMEISMFVAGFLGLNLENDISKEFLNRWYEKAKEKITFQGEWRNENKSVSQDERVQGHRHDMTVGSIIAKKYLNMNYLAENTYISYYGFYEKYKNDKNINTDNVCFLLRGM